MERTKVRKYGCKHEDSCSHPGQFWRYKTFVELLDENCNVIDTVMPERVHGLDLDLAACTECGAPAEAYWSDPIAEGALKAEQGVML